MKISVVIPALNEEKYIAELLESLKKQKTRYEYEVIVADGFSDDNTAKVAKKYGSRVVLEKNRSPAWERNAGSEKADGEVLAFIDADCIVDENHLEKIGNIFENEKDVAVVYGGGYVREYSKFQNFFVINGGNIFLFLAALINTHNPPGFNMSIRKKIFEKCGGFDTKRKTSEDVDLGKRASKFGKLKFKSSLLVGICGRRIKKWGMLYFVYFNLKNYFGFLLTGKSSHKYEDIR